MGSRYFTARLIVLGRPAESLTYTCMSCSYSRWGVNTGPGKKRVSWLVDRKFLANGNPGHDN